MKPSQLKDFLKFSIGHRLNVLITGKPGIGKSDIVSQACLEDNARLIISHPAVSDPTDYKGLPFPDANGTAKFLPFGDLHELINADSPTVYFLDDLGQAPPSVQAAVMQLLLARRVNGHVISDKVSFISATNRREDKAHVQGLLEPVKSRFATIVELEVTTDDWVKWALEHNMPIPLIAFIRFKPDLLDKFEASKDMVNSPTPRTVAHIGKIQNAGLPPDLEFEVFKGAAGEGFSAEYTAFLKIYRELPSVDEIILNPAKAPVPESVAARYGLTGALGARMNDQNIDPIIKYLTRLPKEFDIATLQNAITRDRNIMNTKAFIEWGAKNHNVVL